MLSQEVPLQSHPEWKRFAGHLFKVEKGRFTGTLSVNDVLRRGHLAPLKKIIVIEVSSSSRDVFFHPTSLDLPKTSKFVGYC